MEVLIGLVIVIGIMLGVLVIVEPSVIPNGYRWLSTSSEMGASFLDELKKNSVSIRDRRIEKQFNKFRARIPKRMRMEAANGSLSCHIDVNCDFEIRNEVIDRLYDWSERNGFKPSNRSDYRGFTVNWN